MVEYLVFLLYAPLGAMGSIAVGERRAGFDRPGKSAILGLVAAALGLDRSDEDAHVALAGGYGLGLGEIATGRLLSDYHTTQAPPQRKGRRFATRREELAVDDLGTILSIREYRTEPAYLVVLWARDAPRWHLGQFAEALRRPRFHLYFGRKACPLGAPRRIAVGAGARSRWSDRRCRANAHRAPPRRARKQEAVAVRTSI